MSIESGRELPAALLDIRPPLPPEGDHAWLLLGLLLFAVLLAAGLWRYYQRPPQRAMRRLRQLRRELGQGTVDPRQAAHRLAGALGLALPLQYWPDALAAPLARARFAATPCPVEQLQELLDEAEHLVRSAS
jgi:peptidoglycan/LPS O-acetylase OafA/YrhL